MNNYYQILGLSPQADQANIKAAFKKLALMYHPDRNPDNPQAEEKFKQINEAYTVLSDPSKRFFYDQQRKNPVVHPPSYRHKGPPAPPPPDPNIPYENTYDPANYVSAQMKRRLNWMVLGFVILILVGGWATNRYMNYVTAQKYYQEAQKLYASQSYLLAITRLNLAMAYNPRNAQLYTLRGDINRLHRYNYYDASEDYQWVLENTQQKTGSIYNRLGLCYLKMYEPSDAIKAFEEAIQLSPDSGGFYYHYGEALAMAGANPDKVCSQWKKAQILGFFLPESVNHKKCVE